jgi:hypothetical protein
MNIAIKVRWAFAILVISLLSGNLHAQMVEADSLVAGERDKIHKTYNFLLENNRFTEFLDLTTVIDFPVGIKKTIGNIEYVIAIDSVVMTPTYAYLNASMSFKPPQSEQRIAFRGTNIKFTRQGGLSGEARLELVGDYEIKIPGDKISLILNGEDTFVEWDCDGFKEFGIAGGVNFSRDLLLPIDLSGVPKEGNVQASFNISVGDWNDLVASVSIPPFQITSLKGFEFSVEEAVFDFSDLRNPTGVIFPPDYNSPYFLPGNNNLWRGVYVKSVSIKLPAQFSEEGNKIPVIKGSNLFIDNAGLTGKIKARYLLSLEEGESGSMKGWPFSVDNFRLDLVSGKVSYSKIDGELVLPITDKKSSLAYTAFLDHNNNYFFNISPADSLSFALWQAGEVTLYESSYIEVVLEDGRFSPSALLNGVMSIAVPIAGAGPIDLSEVEFERLQLSSNAPFIAGGMFSLGSGRSLPKMAGFKLDIEKIGLNNLPDKRVSFDIDAGVILSGNKGGFFSATGGFSIISKLSPNTDRAQWQYEKAVINKIALDVDNDACRLAGELEFFADDVVFGNGYSGFVNAEFRPGIKVKAMTRFGTVDEMKYWYADALATFSKPISIAPGFGIYGFGGGAYYHMKMQKLNQLQNYSNSGITYIPDPESGLGIKAALSLGTEPNPEAFNGDASFEVAFYNTGGIRNINFKGEGYFMTLPIGGNLEKLKSGIEQISQYSSNKAQPQNLFSNQRNKNAEVTGHININYDFRNRILHGNVEVFVDAAGGMVRGIGSNNRAGWAVLHFTPTDWYINVGTPTERIGLNMGIGNVFARTNGYFMVGTNIPASPRPDENVSRILGGMDLDYMRDENALGLGTGFALGASLSFDTGNLNFWKFYARFMAGAGFDIMLKNYGTDISCANRQGAIGINGWYANGQAYAFFDGKIGIRVDVFGNVQEIDIINLAAAAVLQAKLPNPVWMRGVVGGYFDALGGLVKGDCRFEVTIGEECDLNDGSVVSGMRVIADVTPAQGDNEVSVFNNPQAVFNMPIDQEFELVDINNQRKTFRIKLDHIRVKSEQGTLNGSIDWNYNHDVAIFIADEVLPPESEIEVTVQISYEEKQGSNWVPVTSKGNIIIEQKETVFTSGLAPDYIPNDNIAYSYPVIEMVNYYPDESSVGYIQLKKGQAYLFVREDNWQQKGRVIANSKVQEFDIEYLEDQKRIGFTLPDVAPNQVYSLQLVNSPLITSSTIDRNVSTASKSLTTATGSDIRITSKKAEGTIDDFKETKIFETDFRTSMHATFADKISSIDISNTLRILLMEWDMHQLRSTLTGSELFDRIEIEGNQYTDFKALIGMEAVLEDNEYYINKIFPLIYNNYPIDGLVTIEERETSLMGLPPKKAIELDNYLASSQNSFQEAISLISGGKSYLLYDLPRYYRQDFYEIREKVIPLYINHPIPLPTQVRALMFYGFPFINVGTYKIKFNYTLPGEQTSNSSYVVNTTLSFN